MSPTSTFMKPSFAFLSYILSAFAVLTPAHAVVIWDESLSGDLSNNQAIPTPFTLSSGTNSVAGTVQSGSDVTDWIALTVPVGFQLDSMVLAAYASADVQGFTGMQIGSSFVGSILDPAAYLGYAHFGTGPGNVGSDLFPEMEVSAGAQGFTAPLASGTYTVLVRQAGAVTNYQFDYNVSAVPEPASLGLIAAACVTLLTRRRRKH